ncbi:efflux RND transporter periplasmic adaptor subunit [Cognatiluteimonas lumbrici]|uniref:efflux RND transporter periplasmic adaptor subunit n=1 Tax=Cognatiluteimonas lumbrici TaxID=2559601 RepID=UPI00112E4724|nr:efflux RND transporter periplasmic adaptor subunit [Luteimonas lumbrici]
MFPRRACLLTILALALAACGGEAGREGMGEGAVTVTTTVVREQAFNDTLQAIGTARARESITVTAKVSEVVREVHFESGDRVGKGAVLVTLSGQQQQAALREAEAAATEAERLYRRQQELAGQQLIARSQLDSQRAARDTARARVEQVRAQLGERVIRAPFAGVLGIRQVSPGALVSPGTPIATLDDLTRMYVDFPVPEGALAHVAPGQTVRGRVGAWPDRRFEGTVETVDARVDPSTRSVVVRASFPNPDRLLRPGMLVTVQLEQQERQALLVPEIAIVQVGQSSFAWRVKQDGSVEQAPVSLGARAAGQVEILRGLEAGDRIVVDGTGKLRPGSTIEDTTTGGGDGAAPAAEAAGETGQ